MFFLPTSEVLCALATAGPRTWRDVSAWTMHGALAELDKEARRAGLFSGWERTACALSLQGPTVTDAESALDSLLKSGLARREGIFLDARWALTSTGLHAGRRTLFRLPAPDAALAYRTGRSWAIRASTSSKNWDSSDSKSKSRSRTPDRRRQPESPVARY
jgi:hypothetical protein